MLPPSFGYKVAFDLEEHFEENAESRFEVSPLSPSYEINRRCAKAQSASKTDSDYRNM